MKFSLWTLWGIK